MSGYALKVQNLSKIYKIYERPLDRIKSALHPLRKRYHRDFYALKDLNFTVAKGETVGIIGKNGSGKSTLLQIVTGVLSPTSGHTESHGKILALLELGAGFNPELTGLENIYFNGTLMGATRTEVDQKVDAIISFADIGAFVHQPVRTYSSGMFVRLAFSIIANMNADILIIDEALAVGDAFFVQKCMRFLRHFQKKGTIFFVSHDIAAVMSLCNRAIYLNQGQIKQMGPAKEVCENYLADTYDHPEGLQPASRRNRKAAKKPPKLPKNSVAYRDQRQDLINNSRFRNDLEVFEFDPDRTSFGQGGAAVTGVELQNDKGDPLSWVVGGERVVLVVRAVANQAIRSGIIGFIVKDRLGQPLFGDNTYLTTIERPFNIEADTGFYAAFSFIMPYLPEGDYAIGVAIAEGSQQHHIQHHWIHDAIIFKSQSSNVAKGLVGIPMLNIEMETT